MGIAERRVRKIEEGSYGIYAVRIVDGPVKIGFSKDIPMRIKRLQADCPYMIEELARAYTLDPSIEGIIRERLHHHQADFGIGWFYPTNLVLRVVDELRQANFEKVLDKS